MISCIFTHIPFSVNKSNSLFKGRSSINILQFNNVNFQIKRFVIFQKFLWNSVKTIWGVIMNFIEITYTKIKYIIRTFPRIRRLSLFFYTRKQNGKKWWKIYAKSVERYVVYLWFVLRIARFNKRRTRNESL